MASNHLVPLKPLRRASRAQGCGTLRPAASVFRSGGSGCARRSPSFAASRASRLRVRLRLAVLAPGLGSHGSACIR
jgi:hypothetical protein